MFFFHRKTRIKKCLDLILLTTAYHINSNKRPGRLFNFGTVRLGAYSGLLFYSERFSILLVKYKTKDNKFISP